MTWISEHEYMIAWRIAFAAGVIVALFLPISVAAGLAIASVIYATWLFFRHERST